MVLLVFIFRALVAFAQVPSPDTGSVAGTVSDAWNGKGLSGVTITVRGFTFATQTDSLGSYKLAGVPPGNHVIQFTKGGYVKVLVENVRIAAGQTTRADVQLKPDFFLMETYEVMAEPFQEQRVQILETRQNATVLLEALGSEQLSRAGVSDAAEALTKVTGATLVDGKFAVIRGLSDRYTSATLNSAEIPSADPYRKSAQLDLFPSSMIDRIEVSKTFTPDQPGGFTGGAINIVTKSFPEKFFLTLSVGGSYNTQSSLNDRFLTSPGGKLDWTGMDDGTRALPEVLADANVVVPRPNTGAANNALLNQFTRSFTLKQMGPTREEKPFNHNFSGATGGKTNLFGRDFGYFASFSYDHKYNFYEHGEVGRYAPSQGGIETRLKAADTRSTDEVAWGTAVSLAHKLSDNNELSFSFLYTQTGENEARRITGFHYRESETGDIFDSVVLHYTERNLQSFQFKGKHELAIPYEAKLDWTVSLATTTQEEPDLRYMSMFHTVSGFTGFANELFPQTPTRYFRELQEDNLTARIDHTLPFLTWAGHEGALKLGLYRSYSDRKYRDRGFSYESINYVPWNRDGDPLNFLPTLEASKATSDFFLRANPPNRYDGDQEISAYYNMLELPVLQRLKLVGGARVEKTRINVASTGGSLATTAARASIQQTDLLPAAGLIYSPLTNLNIRLHYSRTIARPTYREIANVETFDFAGGDILVGNPALKLSSITNYDFRVEWFPKPGNILAAGAFYKELTAPIELAYVTLDQDKITYVNRDEATVFGFEVEGRAGLDLFHPSFKGFSLGANYAMIESETALTPTELAFKRAVNPAEPVSRSLYDQSPFILNLDFSYDNDRTGTALTLAYNLTGRRLAIVNPFGDDVYEHPGESLDLSLSQRISKHWKVKFSAKNLLDPVFKRTYGENGKDIYSSYTKGRQFGVSLSCSF